MEREKNFLESADNSVENGVIDRENEKGASLVEYALLVALIALIAIGGMRILGTKVSEQFSVIADSL